MGGSSGSSQKTEPWEEQQPYLKDIFSQAQKYFDTANAQGPWSGYYMAPESPGKTAALDSWYELNRANTGISQGPMEFMQRNMDVGEKQGQQWLGDAAGTVKSYNNANDWVTGNSGRDFLGEIPGFSTNTLKGPSGSLEDTLSGVFMDPANPIIQRYMDAATRPISERLDDQISQFDSNAIAQGAYGGSANAKLAGRAIGDTNQAVLDARSNILYQNLNNERERQFGASMGERGIEAQNFQQREALLQQNREMELNALLEQFGMDSSNVFNAAAMEQTRNNMLAGMGNDAMARGMTSANMIPQMFQFAQQPYQNMAQIGDMMTNQDQRVLDNARQMYENQQGFNWDQLSNYRQMVDGGFGSSTTTAGGGGSPLMGAAGGAALGGMAGSALAGGASGAALSGALGMSAATGGWAIPIMLALAGAGAGGLLA